MVDSGIASFLSDRLRVSDDTTRLAASWNNAKPFKHIILDDILDPVLLDGVCREIPRIDDETWESVANRTTMFTQEWPWRIRCTDVTARYVRLQSPKASAALCLSEVEVYQSPVMAQLP